MPVPPPFRLARATVFAAVCAILTSLGHFAAAGRPVAPWTIMFGFVLVLAFALVLSGHERSLATILGGLLLGQFVLHALFAAGHGQHHSAAPSPAHTGADGRSGVAMTAAHVLAAILSAWWLRRGERRAWHLARQLVRVLVPSLPPVLVAFEPPDRRAVAPPERPRVRPLTAVLRHALVLRGPPMPSPALS